MYEVSGVCTVCDVTFTNHQPEKRRSLAILNIYAPRLLYLCIFNRTARANEREENVLWIFACTNSPVKLTQRRGHCSEDTLRALLPDQLIIYSSVDEAVD